MRGRVRRSDHASDRLEPEEADADAGGDHHGEPYRAADGPAPEVTHDGREQCSRDYGQGGRASPFWRDEWHTESLARAGDGSFAVVVPPPAGGLTPCAPTVRV